MYTIKIFCPFAESSVCKTVYEKIYNLENYKNYGQNKSVFITDGEKYTHAIIINTCMPILNIPKENVVGFAFEPYELMNINANFVTYAQKCIGKYFIGEKRELPDPFIEHFGYMWHSSPHKSLTYKPYLMSICVSEKQYAPGHIYRHHLVREIIRQNLPVDVFGRGCALYSSLEKSNIKGTFDDAEPYEKYLFSICIENFQNNDYISEKLLTPLLYNCMPIYRGAKNVNKYFKNDILLLMGEMDHDICFIKSILTNPSTFYRQTYTEKNINTVNFVANINKLFT